MVQPCVVAAFQVKAHWEWSGLYEMFVKVNVHAGDQQKFLPFVSNLVRLKPFVPYYPGFLGTKPPSPNHGSVLFPTGPSWLKYLLCLFLLTSMTASRHALTRLAYKPRAELSWRSCALWDWSSPYCSIIISSLTTVQSNRRNLALWLLVFLRSSLALSSISIESHMDFHLARGRVSAWIGWHTFSMRKCREVFCWIIRVVCRRFSLSWDISCGRMNCRTACGTTSLPFSQSSISAAQNRKRSRLPGPEGTSSAQSLWISDSLGDLTFC